MLVAGARLAAAALRDGAASCASSPPAYRGWLGLHCRQPFAERRHREQPREGGAPAAAGALAAAAFWGRRPSLGGESSPGGGALAALAAGLAGVSSAEARFEALLGAASVCARSAFAASGEAAAWRRFGVVGGSAGGVRFLPAGSGWREATSPSDLPAPPPGLPALPLRGAAAARQIASSSSAADSDT